MSKGIMSKGDDIEERLVDFAVKIVNLCAHLPKSEAGKHIGGQLLRSGTSPAANYAEARGADRSKDFIHKLKISLKELNETRVWLKIIYKTEMQPESELQHIIQESDELCRIINASIKTTLARNK
jgi:four helix bundle protein